MLKQTKITKRKATKIMYSNRIGFMQTAQHTQHTCRAYVHGALHLSFPPPPTLSLFLCVCVLRAHSHICALPLTPPRLCVRVSWARSLSFIYALPLQCHASGWLQVYLASDVHSQTYTGTVVLFGSCTCRHLSSLIRWFAMMLPPLI